MTQSLQDKRFIIGDLGLDRDAETIQAALKDPEAVGIELDSLRKDGLKIYRPATPLATENDVIREMRKFLVVIAAAQGRSLLKVIKDPKRVLRNTLDFEEVYQNIKKNFNIHEE